MDEAGETSKHDFEKNEHVIIPIEEEEELPSSKDKAVRTGAGETDKDVIIPIDEELSSSKENAVRTGAGETREDVILPIMEKLPSRKDNITKLMTLTANRNQRRRSNSAVRFMKSDPKAVNYSKKIIDAIDILEKLDSKKEVKKSEELDPKAVMRSKILDLLVILEKLDSNKEVKKSEKLHTEEGKKKSEEVDPKKEIFGKLLKLEFHQKQLRRAKPITGPKIQKVSPSLRDHEDLEKYCKPRAVSLGPIHHGSYPQAEEVKLRLTYQFIKDSGKTKEVLYQTVEDSIEKLRECFDPDETKKYDDEKLAAILFVDGCSLLQFIYYTENRLEDLKIKKDKAEFGRRDLFLLENQLPFKLLKDLIELSDKKKKLEDAISTFVRKRGGNYDKKKELNNLQLYKSNH